MLRKVLLGFACILTLFGVSRVLAGEAHAWPMAAWGLVLLLAVVFERWRYTQRGETDVGEWQATPERFIDPESGKLMQVLYQPVTGERRYVAVEDATESGE
jgi:hypothetical protein